MKILNRFNDKVIFKNEYSHTMRDCVELAVQRGADLRSTDLSDADLRNANLSDANLRNADLRSTDLSDADLRNANLSDANLRGADLRGANLRNADLRNANLSDANLRSTYLSDADLSDANLRGATGNNREIKTIQAGRYIINIVEDFGYMQIGCERYTIKEWFEFDDETILEMGGREALVWWQKWKPILQLILECKNENI